MFATRIKELRVSHNLTQAELAEKLSLKPSIIGMYENNKRIPEVKTLTLISELFNVSTDYLLDRTNIKERFLPNNLKILRGKRTVDEYSKFLNISNNLLSRYESGEEIPTQSIINYIAEREEISPNYFFEISCDPNKAKSERNISNSDIYDNDIVEWINSPDSKEYIEFIYRVYKQGCTKEMLSRAEIKITIN